MVDYFRFLWNRERQIILVIRKLDNACGIKYEEARIRMKSVDSQIDGGTNEDITARINKASIVFKMLKNRWSSYSSYASPTLLY